MLKETTCFANGGRGKLLDDEKILAEGVEGCRIS